jgi:Zn-dependent membrane protease YugP
LSDVQTEFLRAKPGKSAVESLLLQILALIQVTLFALIALLAVYTLCAVFDATAQAFKQRVSTEIESVDRQSDATVRMVLPALPGSTGAGHVNL